MKRFSLVPLLALAYGTAALAGPDGAGSSTVDLTQWTPPNIAAVADDAFGALVKYGHALFTDTANEIGPAAPDAARRFAGSNLACQNCHLKGGTQPYAMPLIGVWGQFPQYRGREGAVDRLEDRINGCMERSVNGRALPLRSRQMEALSAYMHWLSTGIPDGAKLVGAGTLRINEPARAADPAHGAQVFARICATCHGADGLGQHAAAGAGYQFPPLWGPDSFNNGAGMSRLLTAAAFAMHNMPIGTTFDAPVLTDDEAYDVAAYMLSRERPEKANLDQDYPVRLQKPIDTAYGPYVDDFSLEQHRYGPFGPIRARVQELTASARTANAGGSAGEHAGDTTGEPDDGSGPSPPAR
jgi:thiosulfate dehydrogenase